MFHSRVCLMDFKKRLPFILAAIAFACIGLGFQRLSLGPSAALKVWFLDVGQGDAILVETPGGEQVLIDGGPSRKILGKLGGILWPWDRTIEAMVLTHPDADHVTGLAAVAENYAVGTLYESGRQGNAGADRRLADLVVHTVDVRAGESFDVGGVHFDVLWPNADPVSYESNNDASVVLRLTYGNTSVLLMGDLETVGEQALVQTIGPADVLKLGHHGSNTSTTSALLSAVQPREAVIEVGEGNSYGHPTDLVLSRLGKRGISVLRTDQDGDVLLRSYGGEPLLLPHPLPF